MSYMRGNYYLWADPWQIHIWARDGYDYWDETGWNDCAGEGGEEDRPSGVALPVEVADEFVVMRVAQLIEAGQLTRAVTRAIEKWEGNSGCLALAEFADRLKNLAEDIP